VLNPNFTAWFEGFKPVIDPEYKKNEEGAKCKPILFEKSILNRD
jgi:hypothetical protein